MKSYTKKDKKTNNKKIAEKESMDVIVIIHV